MCNPQAACSTPGLASSTSRRSRPRSPQDSRRGYRWTGCMHPTGCRCHPPDSRCRRHSTRRCRSMYPRSSQSRSSCRRCSTCHRHHSPSRPGSRRRRCCKGQWRVRTVPVTRAIRDPAIAFAHDGGCGETPSSSRVDRGGCRRCIFTGATRRRRRTGCVPPPVRVRGRLALGAGSVQALSLRQ